MQALNSRCCERFCWWHGITSLLLSQVSTLGQLGSLKPDVTDFLQQVLVMLMMKGCRCTFQMHAIDEVLVHSCNMMPSASVAKLSTVVVQYEVLLFAGFFLGRSLRLFCSRNHGGEGRQGVATY